MDDYTLQQELEALAGNASNAPPSGDGDAKPEPMRDTQARWTRLFGLTDGDAAKHIMDHRNNLTRTRVSDAHWETVRAEKEAAGYDREAYEHELELQKHAARLPNVLPTAGADDDAASSSSSPVTYLIELTGPLESAEMVRRAAGLDVVPPVVHGRSVEDGRPVSLCCVDGGAKAAILRWASSAGTTAGFEPTILVDPRSLR